MIHSLLPHEPPATPKPETPDTQTLGCMIAAAIELARADEEDPLPVGMDFRLFVSFEDSEIEVEWDCQCGNDDCTGAFGSAFSFDELTEIMKPAS